MADEPKKPASAPPSSTTTAEKPEVFQFILHPAMPPYAALKYRLLPRGIEQTPGNAAPHFFRAALMIANDKAIQDVDAAPSPEALSKLDQWLDLPLDLLSKNDEAQRFFNERPSGLWDLINLAARREQCNWDLPIREFNFSTMIPELIKMRDIGRLLAFKARIEMSRGQLDASLETLKTGMALARHAANAQTLVNALVGIKVAHLMLEQVELLIQQPRCPNLYWTFTELPEPLIGLSAGLSFERDFVELYFPELHNIRNAVHTDADWDAMLLRVADKFINVMQDVGGPQKKNLEWFGQGALFAISAYPKAKAQLEDAGYTAAQIKEMSVSQAILTAEVETFDHACDDIHKWFYADPPHALQGLAETEKEFKSWAGANREIIPMASLLLPALNKCKAQQVQLDCEVAALRCLEAIRFYAAKHDGHLPNRLSDIQEVPIPNDPFSGQPFTYSVHDGRAVLTASPPAGVFSVPGLHWEIEMANVKK